MGWSVGLTVVLACAALARPASAQTAMPMTPVSNAIDLTAPVATTAVSALDHLSVKVFREPELSVDDLAVDESGRITLPLVGTMMAAGKAHDVLAAEIEDKLKVYLKQPKVAISLKQAASRRVTVAGSVVQPGVYPLEGRLTLLQAVALARGPSQVADRDQTFIFRVRNGQRMIARFDLDDIAKGKIDDPEVISGDTVSIGTSGFKTAWRDVLETVRSFNIFRVFP